MTLSLPTPGGDRHTWGTKLNLWLNDLDDRTTGVPDLTEQVTNAGTGVFNILDYGAIADGVTDATTAIQAAIDAAAVSGGTVVIPTGAYKVTSLNFKGNVAIEGTGSSDQVVGSKLVGTAGSDILVMNASSTNPYGGRSLRKINLSGGRRGLSSPVQCTFVHVSDVIISSQSHANVYVAGSLENWYFEQVTLAGADYGFFHDGTSAVQPTWPRYMDKCTFVCVKATGQLKNGWYFEDMAGGGTCCWISPIITNTSEHGFYVASNAAVYDWSFINCNTEGIGNSNANVEATASGTASIAASSTSLTLDSVDTLANLQVGDPITVMTAGALGLPLDTTITNIVGSTLTLALAATYTVSAVTFVTGRYDDFHFEAGTRFTFIGGLIGTRLNYASTRYGIYFSGPAHLSITNMNAGTVHDPYYRASVYGGQVDLYQRHTDVFGTYFEGKGNDFGTNGSGGQYTVINSPRAKPFICALSDSVGNGSGTFSEFRWLKNDNAGKTRLMGLDGATGNLDVKGGVQLGGTYLLPLRLGNYRLWVNPGDGKLYIKSSAPSSATDGTVVGTQS